MYHLQEGKCLCCGRKRIDHYHHIVPRSKGGSDRRYNKAGFCNDCHDGVHLGKLSLEAEGEKKRYAGTSILNQAIPHTVLALEAEVPDFNTCTGRDTHSIRELFGIPKDHDNDAFCIAAYGAPVSEIRSDTHTYEVQQYRRHDRSNIKYQRERTYRVQSGFTKTGKPKYKAIAKNRKPRFGQEESKFPALSELGLTRQQISVLNVKKSCRAYNDRARLMPGTEFFFNRRAISHD